MKSTRIFLSLGKWKCLIAVSIAVFQLFASGSQIYVAENGSGDVEQFNSVTQSGTTFASGLDPIGLAFNSAGDLFVGDNAASTIYRYSPGGTRTTFATAGLQNPIGLAVDSAGDVYAANLNGNDITKYTSTGAGSLFANVSQPKGLTFDSSGNLYVSTANNTIVEYNSQGQGQVIATATQGLNGPLAMQFNSDGDLFVANYFSSDILERNTAGNWSVFATTPSGYSNPLGLTFGPDGTMYVTCAGNFIEQYNTQGDGSLFASTGNGPWMIAVAPVPEPSTFAMLIAGAATIWLRKRVTG